MKIAKLDNKPLMLRLVMMLALAFALAACGADEDVDTPADGGVDETSGDAGTADDTGTTDDTGTADDAETTDVADAMGVDSEGSGDVGDAGGVEDTGPAPVDQCTNEADQAIINGGTVDITAEAQECGVGCLGDDDPGACSVTCIVDATDISAECATCFGAMVGCSIQFCLAPCGTDPASEECGACQSENCADAFYSCTGFPTEDPDAGADADAGADTSDASVDAG